jgi:hypothetical protein
MSHSYKRTHSEDNNESVRKKKHVSNKQTYSNVFVSCKNTTAETLGAVATATAQRMYTQGEVNSLLQEQEQIFRRLLEEKLREQYNMFNQHYIENIFKDYQHTDVSYIN